jgi:HAAS domain-containing protein
VGAYLADPDKAASRILPERRRELVGEVREHIEFALAEAGRTDESTVRNVLERLGSPDEIVTAEAGPDAPLPGDATASHIGGRRDQAP